MDFPIRLFSPVDEVSHEAVLAKLIGTVDQVFPHEVFREREGRERELLDDFKAGYVTHLPAHGLENLRNIDAAFVAGQLSFEFRDAEVEVAFQKLEQGRIDPDIVLVVGNSKRRLGRSALQLDWNEHKGRAVDTGIACGLLPSEEPCGEKERIRATLLHVALGAPIERHKTVVHVLAGERHDDLPALEGIAHELLLYPFPVFGREGPVTEWIFVNQRQPPELLSCGKFVFKSGDARTAQGERLLCVPIVEQPVSQRQIKKLALPPLNAIPGRFRRLFADFPRQQPEVRQWRKRRGCRLIDRLWIGGIPDPVTCKRTDAGGTRPRNVDSHHELGVAAFGETAATFIYSLIETDRGAFGQQRGLDRHELVALHCLSNGDHIRFRRMAKIPLENPDPDPRMAL